eukprot:m.26190 g.26190  ORF g.26190 m.26190 type:complete len:109 (-) comp7774_c0_seq1:240-566(-)
MKRTIQNQHDQGLETVDSHLSENDEEEKPLLQQLLATLLNIVQQQHNKIQSNVGHVATFSSRDQFLNTFIKQDTQLSNNVHTLLSQNQNGMMYEGCTETPFRTANCGM